MRGALGRLIDATPGQTLLVRGASSSVGQAAVAYAKARGLRVVATTRSTENAGRLAAIGADAVVIGLLGGAPELESLHLMNDLPAATRLSFFPSGLFGTAALPASDTPLKWIAGQIASGAMPSLRVETFDFDAVRRGHSLIESDRALGKLVVTI